MLGHTEAEKKDGPGYFRAGMREYYQQLRDAVSENLIDYASA